MGFGFFRQRLTGWHLSFILLLLFTFSGELANAAMRDRLAGLDRFLATFDPGGRFLTRPIERLVPGLTLNGTYTFASDALLSSHDNVGFRDRDYRWLQFQSLFELEANYQVNSSIQITGIFHALYDPVYSLQGSDGLYAPKENERLRGYEDSKDIVRELYVSLRTLKFDLVLGKQQIAWGKMDGRFIDAINPMDGRESVQLESTDYERRRIPLWMANLTYYVGSVSLNFLWIPGFEPDEHATYGSPWYSPLYSPADSVARHNPTLLQGNVTADGYTVDRRSKPNWNDFAEHQLAFRVDVPFGAWTAGLIYFYAWDKNPSDSITGRFTENGVNYLSLERRHRRLHHFGFTADYAGTLSSVPIVGTLPVVLRVEALLSKGVPFADLDEYAVALEGADVDGLRETDTIKGAFAFEFAFPHNTTFIFQPSLYYTKDWKSTLGSGFGGAVGDSWALAPVIFIKRPFRFTRDRLAIGLTLTPYLSQPTRNSQGMKTKVKVSYEFSQYLRGKIVYTNYSGGDGDDLFGGYRRYDNIGIGFIYEF